MRDSTLSSVGAAGGTAATMVAGRRSDALRLVGTTPPPSLGAALGVPGSCGKSSVIGGAHHGVVPPLPLSMVAEFLIDLPAALLIMPRCLVLGDFLAGRRALKGARACRVVAGCPVCSWHCDHPDIGRPAPDPRCVPGRQRNSLYDVTMIDVDITLNRWGFDHDPAGKMYGADHQIPAIRAKRPPKEVSLGLRDDPIQPLVIRATRRLRADQRENDASGGFVRTQHIDGLANTIVPGAESAELQWRSGQLASPKPLSFYWVPDEKALEVSTTSARGGHRVPPSTTAVRRARAVEPAGSQWLSPKKCSDFRIRSGWEAIKIWAATRASFR